MRTLIAATAALTLMAPALATPALAGDWTGAYVGLGVGNTDFDGPGIFDGDDVSYGLHAGYDFDFGDFVLGGELEYDWTDVSLAGGAGQLDSMSRLKLKAGYDFGQALGYAIVGAARANSSIGDDSGLVYGLGVAYAINDQFTLSGEYLRHDFNNFNGTGFDATADVFNIRASFRF